jgi:transcriptional regulator
VEPWALSDAPHEFTERLVEAIVGIEIVITKLVGKWKMSQNQPAQNRASVIDGLRASGGRENLEMAALVEATSRKVQ